ALALASESALRVGAGYVVAAVPVSCVDPLESRVAEVVKRGLAETPERSLALGAREEIIAEAIRADAVAIGPGLSRSRESQELARELLERVEAPIVLDADGLNAFEGLGIHRMHGPLILTPHYAEAARLGGQSIAEVARDPAGWARRFSDESRAIVCLKSTPMITASPAEPLILNATGNPGMATAGAGDVLTGTIAGRVLERRGMIVASEGNLSARITSDRILITRRGRRKGDLTTRDFVDLSLGEPLDSQARAAASTEHRLHLAAYAARADIEALVHAHPAGLSAFAVRGEVPDLPALDEARDVIHAPAGVP